MRATSHRATKPPKRKEVNDRKVSGNVKVVKIEQNNTKFKEFVRVKALLASVHKVAGG
jgi:hypothetical protein